MINFDEVTRENTQEYNPRRPQFLTSHGGY